MPYELEIGVGLNGEIRPYRVWYLEDVGERAEAVEFFSKPENGRLVPLGNVPDLDIINKMSIDDANAYSKEHPAQFEWEHFHVHGKNLTDADLDRVKFITEPTMMFFHDVSNAGCERLLYFNKIHNLCISAEAEAEAIVKVSSSVAFLLP